MSTVETVVGDLAREGYRIESQVGSTVIGVRRNARRWHHGVFLVVVGAMVAIGAYPLTAIVAAAWAFAAASKSRVRVIVTGAGTVEREKLR